MIKKIITERYEIVEKYLADGLRVAKVLSRLTDIVDTDAYNLSDPLS